MKNENENENFRKIFIPEMSLKVTWKVTSFQIYEDRVFCFFDLIMSISVLCY
jgi:hypothetical protein